MNSPVPTIAVHGVGRHPPGRIEGLVKATVGRGQGVDLSVAEFNWDQYVDHRRIRSGTAALENLQRVCASFHATAAAVLMVTPGGLDARLAQAQLVCGRLLRRLIAVVVAAVFGIPAIVIIVLLPTSLLQIAPIWPVRELRWVTAVVVPGFLCVLGALVAGIVALGCARAVVGRSLAPIRSAVASSVLTCLGPLVAILSTPVSISWMFIGAIVLFFSVCGVLISLVELVLPDTPAYTVWRDFVIAPYLLGVVGGLAGLHALRFLLGQLWHEGPIKVLLDITRYVGEPEYRFRTLNALERFVRDKQGDSPSIVIVAHSLGSIIVLDYLCNWRAGDSGRRVSLITLGSPYRRFFLRWLPGVLFDLRPSNTVARIGARHRSFRWVNVYRPWDYVGTALKVRDTAFADRSTRQYLRLNGHGDYWSDDVVLCTVRAALSALPLPSVPAEVPDAAYIPVLKHPRRTIETRHSARLVALGCISIAWMVYSFAGQHSELARMRAAIDERGIHAQVFVAHREVPDVADEMATAHEFHFIGLDMPPYQLSPGLPASVAQQRLDHRRLEKFVRSNCQLEHRPAWHESDRMLLCTSREPIEIAYLPPAGDLDFYLPDFPSRFYFRDVLSYFLYPLLMVALAFLPGSPFALLASAPVRRTPGPRSRGLPDGLTFNLG
jgi:hypothetical protein